MNERKDGRPLVTQHATTWEDMIEVVPSGELVISDSAIRCGLGGRVASDSMALDEDPSSDDFDTWGA